MRPVLFPQPRFAMIQTYLFSCAPAMVRIKESSSESVQTRVQGPLSPGSVNALGLCPSVYLAIQPLIGLTARSNLYPLRLHCDWAPYF